MGEGHCFSYLCCQKIAFAVIKEFYTADADEGLEMEDLGGAAPNTPARGAPLDPFAENCVFRGKKKDGKGALFLVVQAAKKLLLQSRKRFLQQTGPA